MQAQLREWYLQAFARIQAGTTGAIAVADEADAEDATPDKGVDASTDRHMMQHKVGKDFDTAPAFMFTRCDSITIPSNTSLCGPHQQSQTCARLLLWLSGQVKSQFCVDRKLMPCRRRKRG